jgi:hypothetical protein
MKTLPGLHFQDLMLTKITCFMGFQLCGGFAIENLFSG